MPHRRGLEGMSSEVSPHNLSDLMLRFPFARLIGMELERYEYSDCVLSLTVDPVRHHNPQHVVHGSVLHALADTCMGMALYTTLSPDEWCATIEIKISYFRAVGSGHLRATSQMLHRGKRVGQLLSSIYAGEEMIASASGSFAIFDRQSKV